MSKLYLSFLFLGLTALYCPEGEFLPEWKQARYEELTALKGSRKLTYDELSEMFGLELDALAEEEHQARLQRQDEVIFELQSREAQLQAQLQQVKAAQAQDPSGTGNLPYVPTDPATVEQVIDPLGQMGGATDWEQSYAQRIDDLLKQYDEIIQRIANLSKQGVIAKEPYFNAAQALAEGIQDALGALDNHVDGTSGETYRQMLERVKKEGLSFEEKADRAMAQINLTLDTLRAMAFDDVSNIVKTFAGGLEMLPGDIKDFKSTTQIIFGLTDQGTIDKSINLGDTPSAQAFRQFGMELFTNAQDAQALEDILGRWRTQVFTDLVKSMNLLQASTMPDISLTASVLKPILEVNIKEMITDANKSKFVAEDGKLARSLFAWKTKQSADPLFELYEKLSGSDQQVLEYKQQMNEQWVKAKAYMRVVLVSNGAMGSSLEAAQQSLEALLQNSDSLSFDQLKSNLSKALQQTGLTLKDLESYAVLKQLSDSELTRSKDASWSAGRDDFDTEDEREEFYQDLSNASETLKRLYDLTNQLQAKIIVHSTIRDIVAEYTEWINLTLSGRFKNEDGQLVNLSPEEQFRKLEEKLEDLTSGYDFINREIKALDTSSFPQDSKDQLANLLDQIGTFKSSLDKAETVVQEGLKAAKVSPATVKNELFNKLDTMLKDLPNAIGTDPEVQKRVKPFSDVLINLKTDIENLDFPDLNDLLTQFDAADAEAKQGLLEQIKKAYEQQNSMWIKLYEAKNTLQDITSTLSAYAILGRDYTAGDFPAFEVPDFKDTTFSGKQKAINFGQSVLNLLSPAKITPEDKQVKLQLGKRILFDGEWQQIGDNFVLNSYQELIAEQNLTNFGFVGEKIDWSQVTENILLKVADLWLAPIKDTDPKVLSIAKLRLIGESWHQFLKQGGVMTDQATTYRSIQRNLLASPDTFNQFLFDCHLGGSNVLASRDLDKTFAALSDYENLKASVASGLSDLADKYTAWLEVIAGQDRARVKDLIQNK